MMTLLSMRVLAIDIDDVQSAIFTPSCSLSGCHNGSVSPNLQTGVAFDNVVGVSALQSVMPLIDPGNPDNSYLILKMEGSGSGARMPIGGTVSTTNLQLIRDWVSNGAVKDDGAGSTEPDADGDTIADATNTGLPGGPGEFVNAPIPGLIGDNPILITEVGRDVDMLRLDLETGDRVTVDIDRINVKKGSLEPNPQSEGKATWTWHDMVIAGPGRP